MSKEHFEARFLDRTLKGGVFKIEELKAEGGQGAIFLAKDLRDRSVVAVKLFDTWMDKVDVENEAKLHASLKHPNIVLVQCYDTEQIITTDDRGVNVTEDYPFIVMIYANSGSLRDQICRNKGSLMDRILRRGSILPIKESVDYLVQAVNGVQYIHDNKIIHRDLKPGNFLLHQHPGTDHLDLMITDFGCAIKAHSGTALDPISNQNYAGTIQYMAPEHFEEKAVIGSDLYSLGIVAYELLTGKKPFDSLGLIENYMDHKYSTPPSFDQVLGRRMKAVLGELEEVVRKALEKNPKDRHSSANDFGEELKEKYKRAVEKAGRERRY